MNIHWLLGFIEGEGSFGVTVGTKKYKGKKYSWPKIQVQITQADKKPLVAIKEFLKEHNVKSGVYGPYKNTIPVYKNSKISTHDRFSQMFFLNIDRIEDSLKLIELLDPLEWQTKKRLNYEKWKECVLRKSR